MPPTPRSTTTAAAGGRAVVVGGSVSGLLAARALTGHFGEVVLVERDRFPDGPEGRKGVPQSRHVHVLLKEGERILGAYFPGLLEEMRSEGSERWDMSADTAWFYFGGWKKRFPSGMDLMCQSRGFLEWKLRSRVLAAPNLRLVAETDATAFLVAPGTRSVRGVRIASRGGGGEEEIAADLVVDASGRGTRTPQWLEALGHGRVETTEIRVDVGYASRVYRPPAGVARDWHVLLVYPRFPETRLGVIVPAEGGRWIVTLVGWFGDHPPDDEAGFLDFAARLAVPDLANALRGAEPLSPIALHKFPANLRRHYERMADFPDGLAVVGDATCSFNPIYGQGMAAGAVGACTLDAALADERVGAAAPPGFSRRFQRRLAQRIDTPWLLATCEDLRNPAVAGARPAWLRALQWYTGRVHRLTWRDDLAARRFLEVMHLTRTPAALFHPAIVLRALGSGGGMPGSSTAPPAAHVAVGKKEVACHSG